MGSGIVYCRTREECERMATRLTEEGIPAYAYHAGLGNKVCFLFVPLKSLDSLAICLKT